jgi:hypothetical protein
LNRRAFIITPPDSSRNAVDAWMERVLIIVRDWPAKQPILIAINASSPAVTQTPYLRARLKEMRTLRPDVKWCTAFIPPKTYVMTLMQMGAKLSTGRRQVRIFFDRAKAIEWLAANLT